MKLHAHVGLHGRIEGLIAAPDGELGAGLIADPTLQVCEIRNHGLKGDLIELDALEKLLESHRVKVTPAQGQLIDDK
jgi:hypothetical protein